MNSRKLVYWMVNIYAFAGGNFGVFQGASEAAVSVAILPELATQKNAKSPPARRVAMKMARRQRCSSVAIHNGIVPSSRLGGGPF